MFAKLKEKFKSWTEKVAKAEEEKESEEVTPQEEQPKDEESQQVEIKEKIDKELTPKSEEEQRKEKIEKLEHEVEDLQKEINEKKEHVEEKQPEKPEKITVDETKVEDEKVTGMFERVRQKMTFAKITITQKEFDVYADELEELLLENNVAYEVAEKIVKELGEKIVGKELLKKEVETEIKDAFKEIVRSILIDPFTLEEKIKEKNEKEPSLPFVIMMCGINGTGKTTSLAKIAHQLKNTGLSVVLAAGDTFRAASIEQIKEHAQKLDLKVIAQEYGHDPAAVAYDAVTYAKKHAIDVVMIDTAGRMHSDKNLMNEIEKIARVIKPDLKIFVGESITGNDAVEQAKSFDWHVGIDGVILSKADIDEKGGTALSVGYVTKKPILYLGIGQNYGDVEPFDKEKFIKRLGLDDEA